MPCLAVETTAVSGQCSSIGSWHSFLLLVGHRWLRPSRSKNACHDPIRLHCPNPALVYRDKNGMAEANDHYYSEKACRAVIGKETTIFPCVWCQDRNKYSSSPRRSKPSWQSVHLFDWLHRRTRATQLTRLLYVAFARSHRAVKASREKQPHGRNSSAWV